MATTEQIRATIDRYLETFCAGDAAAWAACFAENATQEDPVGTPPNTGREAIQGFYENTAAMFGGGLKLVFKHNPVIVDHEAALSLYAQGGRGDSRMRVPDIIDLMTFADDGSIQSLRAFWTMESIVPDPEQPEGQASAP